MFNHLNLATDVLTMPFAQAQVPYSVVHTVLDLDLMHHVTDIGQLQRGDSAGMTANLIKKQQT